MGWLRLVGSLKLQVSFAKEPYKTDDSLQMRPTIDKEPPNRNHSVLVDATSYMTTHDLLLHNFGDTNLLRHKFVTTQFVATQSGATQFVATRFGDATRFVDGLATRFVDGLESLWNGGHEIEITPHF